MSFNTVEEMSESLISRWKELHPEYKKPAKDDTADPPKVKGFLTYPPQTTPTMSAAVEEPPRVYDYSKETTEQFKKRAARKLRVPITWVGRLAVGEERFLCGWWAVIVPNSSGIFSFFGPLAKRRAIEQAEKLIKEGF